MDSNTKELKISEIFEELPRLKVFDEQLKTYEDKNSFTPEYKVIDRNTYIGVEVEIENVTNWLQNTSPYWTMIEDGSLRNEGREFITPPIRAWRIEHAFTKLFQTLNPDIDFSERTSIHIHLNIRTLSVQQLEALIVTYMVFEKTLFTFIGNNRYDNIFCVPLCETDLGESLTSLITNGSPHIEWEKYTALNLSPISSKGTIEFRHLHGTKDIKKLMTWINLILSLKTFALRNDVDYIWHKINSLNTTSEYRMFGEEVFGTLIDTLFSSTYNQEISSCITYVKDKCLPNPFIEEIQHLYKTELVYRPIASNTLHQNTRLWDEVIAEPRENTQRIPITNWFLQNSSPFFEEPTPQETFHPRVLSHEELIENTMIRPRVNPNIPSNLLNQLLRNTA